MAPDNYTPEAEENVKELITDRRMTSRSLGRDLKEKIVSGFQQKIKTQDREGYLDKRVGLLSGRWEPRFIKLEKQELAYYKEDGKGGLIRKGLLNFDIYQVTVEVDSKEPGFYLRILNSNHEFYFRAPADFKQDAEKREYLQRWIDEISRHL